METTPQRLTAGPTTGHLHIPFGTPIAWSSKKKPTIALRTCAVDYLASRHSVEEILWLRRMMSSITGRSGTQTTALHIYNLSAILVARNQWKTKRRKHMYIRAEHLVPPYAVAIAVHPIVQQGTVLEHTHTQQHVTVTHIPLEIYSIIQCTTHCTTVRCRFIRTKHFWKRFYYLH